MASRIGIIYTPNIILSRGLVINSKKKNIIKPKIILQISLEINDTMKKALSRNFVLKYISDFLTFANLINGSAAPIDNSSAFLSLLELHQFVDQ